MALKIPMAALVAVMIMVSIGTFSWDSLRNLKEHPLSTNLVMVVTVVVVVATHNLAYGVLVGVLLASLFFANKVGHYLDIKSTLKRRNRIGLTTSWARCSLALRTSSLRF